MLVDPEVPLSKFPSLLVENEGHDPLVSRSVQVKLPLIGTTGTGPVPPFPVLLPPFPVLLPPFPPPLPPLPVVVAFGLTPAHPSPAATPKDPATPNDKVTTDNRLGKVCRRIGLLRRLGDRGRGAMQCPGPPEFPKRRLYCAPLRRAIAPGRRP